eukprot:10292867-Prorocentrum_lima.AAC.1
MTSSLVGSEMCIRDRQYIHPCSQHHSRYVLVFPIRERIRHHVAVGTPKPVSYTHLTLPTICSV